MQDASCFPMFRPSIAHVSATPSALRPALAFLLGLVISTLASAAPPDLTNGGVPGDTSTINLGPTGARGWVYHVGINTSESRQIQVTTVDAGSPTDGILAVNDVILGADGTGAVPANFTSDARKSLASAIADAEARTPATLKLIRWRAGVTTTVQVPLRTMGAYSATAPYNCPKSAKILEEGLQYVMASETAGTFSFGTLTLLAANDPTNPNNAARQLRAQTEARALIPSAAMMASMNSEEIETTSKITWARGHQLIVLAEYYLKTGDALVLPAIQAYVKSITNGQSLFGTMGHQYTDKWPDGSPNGPMGGHYGVVNSAGMPCFYGLLLAKQCGVSSPELDLGIERASRFFAYYTGKGTIPYGEHEPYWQQHESNGKSGLGALCFELQNNRADEGKFYSMMATAAASERENGHTGAYFNYLWSPLGAAAGGDEAVASYFSRTSWMYDLCRRWDGSFVYDCLYGQGPVSGTHYYDFKMSTAALLTYALPLRQIRSTGYSQDSGRWLTSTEVIQAVATDDYVASARSTSELVSDLGSWSPKVQREAANQLATRTTETTALLPTLTALATDPAGTSRVGACFALGMIANSSSAPVLAALLTDPVNHVRFAAAEGLRSLPQAAKLAELNTILAAAASTAQPLTPFAEEDPLHMAHGRLAMLIFYGGNAYGPKGILWNDLTGVDRNLLYPAVKAVAATPSGLARSSVANAYKNFSQADMLAVADAVVDGVYNRCPADKMFGSGARQGGLDLLEKYKIAEGVPLGKIYIDDEGADAISLAVLQRYAGSSTKVIPDPDVRGFCQNLINLGISPVEAQAVIDAIDADTTPTTPTPFKSIQSVIPDSATLTLPAKWTTLRVNSTDYAMGESVYTWRKVSGAGNVSFTPNGTAASKNTAVLFDGIPGQYLFEVKMSDSRGLTEVYQTVAMTLYDSGGGLPVNNSPVANAQTPTVDQATPTAITLTATDPEGYALTYVVTTPPIHGTLTGTAPFLVYTSDFSYSGADSFGFQVTDSEGQTASASVNITVNPASSFGLAVYEPFDYLEGALNGQSGLSEVGLVGAWSANASAQVAPASLAYGTLPTLGASIGNLNASSNNYGGTRAVSAAALAGNGLLNDGATLWFSVVVGYGTGVNRTNARLCLALANSNFSTGNYQYYVANEGAQLGSGLGLTLGKFTTTGSVVATQFRDSTFGTGFAGNVFGTQPGTSLLEGQQRLMVGKITWGAASDTIELYEPDANLNLGNPTSTLTVNVNQSTFDSITWSRGDIVTMDEIRFGPTYLSALLGSVAMTADSSPPTPNPVGFISAPTPIGSSAIGMVAATAYDPGDVEYYFTCTAGGGHDSGWQTSTSYTDTGLTPGVLYSYTVKARDKSPANNTTTPSAAASATIATQRLVPDVVSLPQTTAESIIVSVGLTVGGITGQYSDTIPEGTVISQSPVGETTVATGSAVGLVVSLGPVMTTVPNVVGLSQATAQSNIVSANLVVGLVTSQYDAVVPAGIVISQDPTGGVSIAKESGVNLVVSLGPDTAPPTLAPVNIVDNQGGGTVITGALLTYTITFSEDIDGASVTASDFSNAGTSVITIGAIAEISPGIFTVEVTPTTVGTLILKVNAGAVITDTVGNALITTAAIADDTTLTVNANGGSLAVIREPFNMTAGTLNGQAGGTGLSGNWIRNSGDATNDLVVESPGQTYGLLPTSGNSVATAATAGGRAYNVGIGSSLSNAGLLNDGTELWFSVLIRPVVSTNAQLFFQIGSGNVDANGVIAGGNGIGINVQNGSDLRTWSNVAGVTAVTDAQLDLHDVGGAGLGHVPHFVVGKIVWGTGGANDTLQIYLPDANLVLGSQKGSTLSANVNQSTFNRLSVSTSTLDGVDFDEIRFGGSYDAVIGKTTVPNVVGLTQADAGVSIVSANLVVGTVTPQYSSVIPAGEVISQSPVGGVIVMEGSAVGLVVSSGPEPVTVPNVVGLAQSTAQTNIVAASLVVGTVTSQNDAVVPIGNVISQNPAGSAIVPINSTVDLVVSLGPLMVNVPNVVGLFQTPAQNSLLDANLVMGTVTEAYSATVPAGAVISQNPSAGTSVVESSSVSVVISLGPVMVVVPNVVGLAQATAEANLSAVNLAVGSVTSQNSASVPAGNVISQSPGTGVSVIEQSFVNLVVSLGPVSILNYANADTPVSGKVSGSFVNTQVSDNLYEQITEAQTGGSPSSRYSYLEHKWSFNVTATTSTLTFHVEAHHTANTEGDNFIFAYSTSLNGTYVDMVTVTKTSDNNITQTFVMPGGISGTVYVRVVDTNQTAGNKVQDVLYIDDMHFHSVIPDTTAPTLAGSAIVDNKGGAPVVVNTLVNYTLTFSEDMDSSTITAADFGNAGTATISIGSITETFPTSGVFTVPVTPTTTGTLQLKVIAGAILKDVAGNSLSTASAISDNTIINVITAYDSWSGGASFTADANHDGVADGMAWVLGAPNPTVKATALMPTFDTASDVNYFIYNYRRSDVANASPSVVIGVLYGSDMGSWSSAIDDGTNVIITPANDFYGVGIDKIEVKIKRSLAVGAKLFVRLSVLNTQ